MGTAEQGWAGHKVSPLHRRSCFIVYAASQSHMKTYISQASLDLQNCKDQIEPLPLTDFEKN